MSGTAAATTPVTPLQVVNQQDNVPQYVRDFLKTSMGKHFTQEQVMAAYRNNSPMLKAESSNIVSEVKIDENFSKMTAGTEDAPDAVDVTYDIDNYTTLPGWGAFLTYQAGGKAYLGYDEVGEDGPGYLMTPDLDLRGNDGAFKVTFRVKNINPNAQDQVLQYFIMNDDPENKGILSGSSLPMTTDWTDLELYVDGGVQYTSVMFLGWQGKVLVDNVKLEKLVYPLAKPTNIKLSATGGGEVTATWDAVEGASEYYVELLDNDFEGKSASYQELVVATATVSETSAKLACNINASHKEVHSSHTCVT